MSHYDNCVNGPSFNIRSTVVLGAPVSECGFCGHAPHSIGACEGCRTDVRLERLESRAGLTIPQPFVHLTQHTP